MKENNSSADAAVDCWRRQKKRPRCGFTLLELLLVLAIMVFVAAVSLPVVFGPMENQRLRKSADLIRSQWSKARIEAMKSGRVQVFRYQAGGNNYLAEPLFSEDDYLESNYLSVQAGGQTALDSAAGQFVQPKVKQLPEGVLFGQADAAFDMRSVIAENTASTSASFTAEIAWAPPILFYPDGSSSTVRLMLGNTRQRIVVIELRGLTGISNASDLQSGDPLQP